MLKLLKTFIKPYRGLACFTILLLAAQAVSDLYMPNLMSDIVNSGILMGDIAYIINRGGVMLGVALLTAGFALSSSFFAAKIGTMIGRDLRREVFTKVEGFSLHEFNKFGAASLITRTTNDVTQVQNLIVMGFRFILFSPVMCLGGIIMAYSKNRALLWVLLVSVGVLMAVIFSMMKIVLPMFKGLQKKIDGLNRVLRESLMGIRVIRAFNKMDYDNAKFDTHNAELTALSVKIQRLMSLMQPILMLIMSLTSLSITWFGGVLISRNAMEIGDMMAFTQYAMTILFSLLMMVMMFVMMPRAQVSAGRILEVLSVEPAIVDPETPVIPEGTPGLVEFQDVGFAYEGAAEPVLEGVSFTASPGGITAIIGGTGAGKSSLINLIPRFYDATAGVVRVAGADVRTIPQSVLRSMIGFVSQGDILFSGTVADNIRFGKADATDAEVESAAVVAQAHDFIAGKLGFDGEISQGGANVSGGQKQRLAIARAVVRRPSIYIFDDSFSALDYKTDRSLRQALKAIAAEATVIIVAQRISTVVDADKILVLDDGRPVGCGRHDELLRTCAVYREIVESQLREGETA